MYSDYAFIYYAKNQLANRYVILTRLSQNFRKIFVTFILLNKLITEIDLKIIIFGKRETCLFYDIGGSVYICITGLVSSSRSSIRFNHRSGNRYCLLASVVRACMEVRYSSVVSYNRSRFTFQAVLVLVSLDQPAAALHLDAFHFIPFQTRGKWTLKSQRAGTFSSRGRPTPPP